jgi:hypothetical protein
LRVGLPVGPLFCVLNGQTRGRQWSTAAARAELRRTAAAAGVRRRFAPHQLRHAHGVEMAREGVPLVVIQRQIGHSNLGITSVYLQGIDNAEIIDTVHTRRGGRIHARGTLIAGMTDIRYISYRDGDPTTVETIEQLAAAALGAHGDGCETHWMRARTTQGERQLTRDEQLAVLDEMGRLLDEERQQQ